MTNIVHPDMIALIIDWGKQVLHVITTACHDPRSATCRVKGQDEVTTSHFPRSFHMITYHDLWQPHHLPRSLSAAHRVMMTLTPPSVMMTTQNISLPLKRETVLLERYIYKPSHKEEGKLRIPRKRPTDSSLSLWPWLTKPSEGASGHPVRTPFAGSTIESRIYIGWDRASIHLATTWIIRDARPQQIQS